MIRAAFKGGQVGSGHAFVRGEVHDGASLGGFVGQAADPGCFDEFGPVHIVGGEEVDGAAVAVGDGAGLVEQECGDVSGGFHGAARGGQDVVLDQPVHA